MKRTAMTLGCVAVLLAALACETRRDREAPRMSQRELQNRSQLQPYPEPVQAAFLRDHPTANITRVDVFNDVSGRVLYRVNFADGGRMNNAVYSSGGERVIMPAEQVAPPADQMSTPAPAPPAAPRTAPPAPPARPAPPAPPAPPAQPAPR